VPVSHGLRRLLRIREIEEEQSRLETEAAQGDLGKLQHAMGEAVRRGGGGRRLVQAGVRSGEFSDRLAGLEETRAADRRKIALAPRIADAERDVALLREEYLAKRIERRQAETLIEEAEAQEAFQSERRSQQGLDDWYRNQMDRAQRKVKRLFSEAPAGDTAGSGQT
jgi:hypothetical protein